MRAHTIAKKQFFVSTSCERTQSHEGDVAGYPLQPVAAWAAKSLEEEAILIKEASKRAAAN